MRKDEADRQGTEVENLCEGLFSCACCDSLSLSLEPGSLSDNQPVRIGAGTLNASAASVEITGSGFGLAGSAQPPQLAHIRPAATKAAICGSKRNRSVTNVPAGGLRLGADFTRG